jgi:hypothetical protein
LIVYGKNLTSTIGYPPYTSVTIYMVNIPIYLMPMLVGLIISDGWLQINNSGNTRFSLKHLPFITNTNLKGKQFKGIQFTSLTIRLVGRNSSTNSI